MRKYLTNKIISAIKPSVPKTKLDKAKSELSKAMQKTKASKAKLSQTLFEIKNKQPLTFGSTKKKTMSNTEKAKKAKARKAEKFEETMKENKKAITRIFNAPKNFNKGGKAEK